MSSRKERGRSHKVEEPVVVMEAEPEEVAEDDFPIDDNMEAVHELDSGDVLGGEAAEDDQGEPDSPNAKKSGRRKPFSAWAVFCMQQRKIVAEEYPELTFGGVNAKLAEIWKSMSEADRLPFEPKDDGEGRYDGTGDDAPKRRGRKKRARKWTKDPTAPKKALTPYIVFGKMIREEVTAYLKEQDPGTKPTEIMREISARWAKLTPLERAPFEIEALKDRERYDMEKKTWVAQHPEPRTPNKKAKGIQEPGETRILKVRHRGEEIWDKIWITLPCNLKTLIKKIQSKRKDNRPIIEIIHLPDHRVRDTDDINSLLEEAPLEFIFEPLSSSSAMDTDHAHSHAHHDDDPEVDLDEDVDHVHDEDVDDDADPDQEEE